MAEEKFAVGVAEVHAVAFAVFPDFTGGALVFMHPGAVPEGLEACVPDFHEVILVDVSLMIIGSDTGAGGDAAVGKDGTNGDAGGADVEVAAHIALVIAQEPFAAVFGHNPALLTGGLDEIHQAFEFFVG